MPVNDLSTKAILFLFVHWLYIQVEVIGSALLILTWTKSTKNTHLGWQNKRCENVWGLTRTQTPFCVMDYLFQYLWEKCFSIVYGTLIFTFLHQQRFHRIHKNAKEPNSEKMLTSRGSWEVSCRTQHTKGQFP